MERTREDEMLGIRFQLGVGTFGMQSTAKRKIGSGDIDLIKSFYLVKHNVFIKF